MKIKLPIIVETQFDGKSKKEKKYLECNVDFGLLSQMRYESKFPDLAKNEDLLTYTSRIIKKKQVSLGQIFSILKVLYCWIEVDLSFYDFCKLFNSNDEKYFNELIESIKNTFTLIMNSSAEKN